MREGTEKPATMFCIPTTRIALAANILWKQTDGTTVECFFVAVKVPVIVYDSCNLLASCADNFMCVLLVARRMRSKAILKKFVSPILQTFYAKYVLSFEKYFW